MRAEDLLQAIGKVDDALLEQAMEKKSTNYLRWVSLAASLLLVLGLGVFAFMQFRHNQAISPTNSTERMPSVDLSSYKIALITQYGDIVNSSFEQASYEACNRFADEHQIEFRYYKPVDDHTAARVESTELAISEGCNIIVMPGYAFGGAIVELAPKHKDVKFIALDVSEGDMLEAAVANAGESYDYNPDNWDLADYVDLSNVYCCNYREELAGFIAGYAAVQMGYTELGFLGGMAVPAVMRYGYGFIQGADAAAVKLNTDVEIKYGYGGQFYGDSDITNVMDSWYAEGTEAIFACGGALYTSVAEAAMKADGKVIGSDTDQSYVIDSMYGEGLTLTSAMKEIDLSAYNALTDILVYGAWEEYAGKIETLGLEENASYLHLPMESTQWNEGFTKEEYHSLLQSLTNGELSVNADISDEPDTTRATTQYHGYIKG